MTIHGRIPMRTGRVFLLLLASLALTPALPAQEKIAGYPSDEALRLGERMYRQGLLPSGELMKAIVQGDIPVTGKAFSCQRCHMRSGLGSFEGTVVTPPTNGAKLFTTRVAGQEIVQTPPERISKQLGNLTLRPPYTDESLAKAIWSGVMPSGRKMDPIMPLYLLKEPDMKVLIYYLKNLCSQFSPGVDANTMHFATVVTGDAPAEARDAMLTVLQAHVRERNSQVRHQEARAAKGPYYDEEMNLSYRRWELHVWELQGEPGTWRAQLQNHYRQTPVFALLGGMSGSTWEPVHQFCEEEQLPCLFPYTRQPVISDTSWYTLYYDKAGYQEGDSAARFIRRQPDIQPTTPAVQVYREGLASQTAAGFQQVVKIQGSRPLHNRVLRPGEAADSTFWQKLLADHPGAVLALWLEPADLEAIKALAEGPGRPAALFLSARLLNRELTGIPAEIRPFTYLTYPWQPPEDQNRSRLVIERWLQVRKIDSSHLDIKSQAYNIRWLLSDALMHLKRNFYRDYLLDCIDMLQDLDYNLIIVPRLSFGPGQRYAAKGCYIMQLPEKPGEPLIKKSGWVVR